VAILLLLHSRAGNKKRKKKAAQNLNFAKNLKDEKKPAV